MRFHVPVFIFIFCLFFSVLETKAQSKPTLPEKVTSQNNELNEVVIKRDASLVKYSANGTIDVNVANTLLSTSSSVNELLSRVPNVIITEGQISVLGKGEAIIYLNGILINYERFAAIPVSQISKIEVISNPSSKYDAEGKAVINIITKKNIESGIMGTASQQVTVSEFAGASTNTLLDFNYAKGKFSFITNYGLQLGKGRELLYTTRTRPNPEDYMRSQLTTDWKRQFNNYSNFGLGLQYTFSDKNYISLAYSGNIQDLGGVVLSRNSIENNAGNSFYTTDIAKNDVLLNQFINLNYNAITDRKGSSLFIGTQHSNYNGTVRDFIDENSFIDELNKEKYLKNNVDNRINIISIQADYLKKINKNSKLETGVKFSNATILSGSDFLISDSKNEGFGLDDQLSSNFKYVEKINAAYFNFGSSLGEKFNFSVGARAEWTNYDLYTTANGIQQFKKNYGNIFPNVLLNMDISDDWKVHASYVSRITRPRYQALNPFVIYQDPFTTIEGNPNLLPEKVHAFEIGTLYKKFDFKIGYTYKTDPISGAALRGDKPNSYILRSLNLDREHSFFTSISKTFTKNWWNSTNTISMNLTKSIDDFYGYALGPVKPQIYLYSNNTFTIPNLFKIQLLAWYLGNKSYGLGSDNSRSTVTLGIERNFFKDALKLNFTANDIFHDFMVSGDYNVGQTEIYYHRTYTTNYFRLIATYSFGNSKKATYKKTEIEQTENNRAR
ncbi:outer membrane beta-barrel family protein [Flavobacterium hibernum]|uniref:TonB-dependent receptor n=1 Tax=Flavobacterium hibernum TaxID=37752 RepID=A0A0D0EEE1_9FLAO|nr:outer membrane beta-barrel family protein [Flavobacterium hibernum]KIO52194.1 TonB-dependent receptor [Flavobacterium hibernum]OXA87040.1 TonB-dependent receptor [Flavobacterium hibernum]STO14077.1 Outer membrane cobalamin receptor protein [Flavobacterium hibernum]